jgi:hypothetical protein
MQPPPFVAANLDAIQSRANRAGSDARAAARSLAEVQANPEFFVRQGFSLTDIERKIAATEASLAQARADEARFRELHRLALAWLDALPDGTPLVAVPQDLTGRSPEAVLGCMVPGAQPLRA